MSGLPSTLIGGNTLGGTPFWQVQSRGPAAIRAPKKATVARIPVPYSNDTIEQLSGVYAEAFTVSALVKQSDWGAITNRVGQQTTLVLLGDSARAVSVDAVEQVFTDTVNGLVWATLHLYG